jgi:hypothetical protein
MKTVMNKLRFPSITCQKRYESGAPVREVKQFFVNYCEFVIYHFRSANLFTIFVIPFKFEVPILYVTKYNDYHSIEHACYHRTRNGLHYVDAKDPFTTVHTIFISFRIQFNNKESLLLYNLI